MTEHRTDNPPGPPPSEPVEVTARGATSGLGNSGTGKQWALRFLLTALVTTTCVLVVGWFSDIQQIAYGALTSIAIVALLPFAIINVGIAIVVFGVFCAIAAALLGEDATGAAESSSTAGSDLMSLGGSIAIPYYAFLARRRHPVLWGVPFGVLAGGLALTGLISWWIVPGEMRTATILAECAEKLRQHREEHKDFPAPDTEGRLVFDASEGPVLDGFGRALHYEKDGMWILSSYTLTSFGYDGYPGDDDLCIGDESTATAVTRWGAAIATLIFKREAGEKPLVSDRLRAVLNLKCATSGSTAKDEDA